MGERPFRRDESLRAERLTWELVPHFLQARGFIGLREERVQNGQTVYATSPDGIDLVLRTRVCWREDEVRGERPYAAAQLLATIKDNNPEGSLRAKVGRDARRQITHMLLVQREDERIGREWRVSLGMPSPLLTALLEAPDLGAAMVDLPFWGETSRSEIDVGGDTISASTPNALHLQLEVI